MWSRANAVFCSLCAFLSLWLLDVAVAVVEAVQPGIRSVLGEEAEWRLGYWHNHTWCAVKPKAPFDPDYQLVPKLSAIVLPDGEVIFSDAAMKDEKWLERPRYPGWMRLRMQTYMVWRHAPPEIQTQGIRAIPVAMGDTVPPSPGLPIASHCRSAATRWTDGHVLWPGLRHSSELLRNGTAAAQAVDVPWAAKRSVAMWRGRFTGFSGCENGGMDGPCHPGKASRTHLVAKFRGNPLFDVALAPSSLRKQATYKDLLPAELFGAFVEQKDQIACKVLVSIDGVSCSSMLVWALGTNSVVAMVHPLAHEAPIQFGLEPWVHFLPFKDDLSDLEENIAWCFAHDTECEAISRRARRHVARLTDESAAAYEGALQAAMLRQLAKNVRTC